MSVAETGSMVEGRTEGFQSLRGGLEETSDWMKPGHVPGEPGIWILIFGDMALFLLLFGGFMIERAKQVDLFRESSDSLHVYIGLINTLILLTSSIAVALAVRAVRIRASAWAPLLSWAALICALAFVFNKYLEWGDLIRAGVVPTTNDFYLWYFIMTGVHLAHVLVGTCVLVYLIKLTQRARQGEAVSFVGMECGASYWHMVDLLWVILFPLLYLMR